MIVDVSHASDDTARAVIQALSAPGAYDVRPLSEYRDGGGP